MVGENGYHFILACETSSSSGSLALGRQLKDRYELLDERNWVSSSSHNEVIIGAVEGLLKSCRISLSQVDAFALGLGPGSFTGVRIGLNFIKTLAYTMSKPVLGVSSLHLLALQARSFSQGLPICVVQNAFGQKLYCRIIRTDGSPLIEDQVLSPAEVIAHLTTTYFCVGDGVEMIAKAILDRSLISTSSSAKNTPTASAFFEVLSDPTTILLSRFKTWKEVQPLYLKLSTAEEKLQSGDLKKQVLF